MLQGQLALTMFYLSINLLDCCLMFTQDILIKFPFWDGKHLWQKSGGGPAEFNPLMHLLLADFLHSKKASIGNIASHTIIISR